MDPRRPQAEVVHRMPQRARLRLELTDEELPLLEQIARGLAELDSVTEVQATARTRSLLMFHRGELDPILQQAQARGLFELQPARAHAPMRRLKRSLARIDETVAERTHDAISIGNLTFLALLAAGVYQTRRGEFLPAGLALFGYAVRVMDWV